MKKLIINADDFGYSRGVNYGIIDCYQEGVLTSTTFMTNMPGAEHAVQLAKENTGLGIGVHLVLTCGRPLLATHTSIVDINGDFRKLEFYKGAFTIDYDEVYAEWKAQIERFLSYGLQPTHLDSHHHINSFGDLPRVMIRLAREYGLPVRNNMAVPADIPTTDAFFYTIEESLSNEASLKAIFEGRDSVEVMCHPAYLDKKLMATSSFTYPRIDEVEFLTHPDIISLIKSRNDVVLTHYRGL